MRSYFGFFAVVLAVALPLDSKDDGEGEGEDEKTDPGWRLTSLKDSLFKK